MLCLEIVGVGLMIHFRQVSAQFLQCSMAYLFYELLRASVLRRSLLQAILRKLS